MSPQPRGGAGTVPGALALLAVIVLVALVAPAPSAAAAPTAADGFDLALEITPRTVTVGDRITAVLTLTATPDAAGRLAREPGQQAAAPRFPTWGDHWGAAEVLEAGPVDRRPSGRTGDGRATWRQRLVLAAFRPGDLTLPPVTVRLPLAAGTVELSTGAPQRLRVDSVLPTGSDPATLQPTSAAPPRPLPAGASFWWTLAGGALLAGALLLIGSVRRRRRSGGQRETPSLPPFEELAARLGVLADTPPEAIEAGTVALSLALRRYLGRRLGFPAAESTTTEIRRRLRERALPDRVIEPAALVLERCDAVKFARARVAPESFGASVAAARELARTLEEHLAPVTLTPVASGVGDGRRGAAA